MTDKTTVSPSASSASPHSPANVEPARCDATVRDATCRTCPFWQERPGRPEGDERGGYGFCHHVSAAAEHDPNRYGNWWCSEHPLRQRDRLAAMAMQALIPAEVAMPDTDLRRLATSAYAAADAMLAAWRSP